MKHHVFITYLLHIIYITDRSSSVKAFSLTVSAMQLACIVLNVLFKAKLLAIHVPSAHLKGFGARHFLLPLVNIVTWGLYHSMDTCCIELVSTITKYQQATIHFICALLKYHHNCNILYTHKISSTKHG